MRSTLAAEALERRCLLAAVIGQLFFDRDRDAGRSAFDARSPQQKVFLDYDGDGRQDGVDTSGTLNGDGSFTFVDVLPGSYYISASNSDWTSPINAKPRRVTVRAGQQSDAGGFGVGPTEKKDLVDVATDDDVDADGQYDVRMSGDDSNDWSGDAVVVGRIVYIDSNNNGWRDDGENWIETTGYSKTDGFDLTLGTYTIRQELPAGCVETGRATLGWKSSATFVVDGEIRLPGDLSSGKGENGSVLQFLSRLDPDAPDPKTASIGGSAFDDFDRDGECDQRERGLKGGQSVYLDLDDDDDGVRDNDDDEPFQSLVAEVVNQGSFTFTKLAAGTYRVRFGETPGPTSRARRWSSLRGRSSSITGRSAVSPGRPCRERRDAA